MKILITGAHGFVGQHLFQYLKNKKHTIHTIGRARIEGPEHTILNDVTDKKTISDCINNFKPDYVFHLAGSAIVKDSDEAHNINSNYATLILEALDKVSLLKKTKVLIMGSAAEYGFVTEDNLPINEDFKGEPYSLYGKSKLTQTLRILKLYKNAKLVIVRPFTIIGPKMPDHLAIGSFVKQIKESNQDFLETGNLNTSRDFIHVDDTISILWKLINQEKAYGEIVNICSGKETKIHDMVDYLIELSNKEIELKIKKERKRDLDMPRHYGDNSKLIELIGPIKFTPWKESLQQMMSEND